jgi:hypothetical protein
MERVQVVVRLVLMVALGALGYSSLYWVLYLALPAIAALLVSSKGPERYLAEDAPRIIRGLTWLAAAYAYLWMLTDAVPTGKSSGDVELEVETGGTPTARSALLRLVYSFPALILLALLSMLGTLLGLVGAICILVSRRLPHAIFSFLSLTLRYQFRLAAYHLSLVDRYPSFEEAPIAHLPQAGAA